MEKSEHSFKTREIRTAPGDDKAGMQESAIELTDFMKVVSPFLVPKSNGVAISARLLWS